jgi:rhodanese-related sulfurtransferase
MGIGWAFAGQIQQVLDVLATLGVAAVEGLLVLAAAYLALRWWRRRLFLRDVAMPRIAVDELLALMAADPAPLVVDVRSDAARSVDARRIPGAIGVELRDIERIAAQWPRDREVVLYCNCPNEASAASAARMLAAAGFVRVRPLQGGLEAWVASGQRIELHVPGGPHTSLQAGAAPTA